MPITIDTKIRYNNQRVVYRVFVKPLNRAYIGQCKNGGERVRRHLYRGRGFDDRIKKGRDKQYSPNHRNLYKDIFEIYQQGRGERDIEGTILNNRATSQQELNVLEHYYILREMLLSNNGVYNKQIYIDDPSVYTSEEYKPLILNPYNDDIIDEEMKAPILNDPQDELNAIVKYLQ